MRLPDVLRMAKDHMVASKFRTSLTVLGIVMGVMAMTAIMSVSEGFGVAIRDAMETYFNVRVIFVTSIGFAGTVKCELYLDDVEAMRNIDGVDTVFPGFFATVRVEYPIGNDVLGEDVLLVGSVHSGGKRVWPSLYVPLAGEIPADTDNRSVVLGYEIATSLAKAMFGSEDPTQLVGRTLYLRGSVKIEVEGYNITMIMSPKTVKVKAVLKKSGVNLAGFDMDAAIIGTFDSVKEYFRPPKFDRMEFNLKIDRAIVVSPEGELLTPQEGVTGGTLYDIMSRPELKDLREAYESWWEDKIAGSYDDVTSIIVVYAEDADMVDAISEEISDYFERTGRAPRVIAMKAYARAIDSVFAIFRTLLAVLGVIAVLVASLGVFNTMTTSVRERVKEIGIMKAIGATSGVILKLFWVEAILMGILGSFAGVLIGWGVAYLIAATGLLKGVVAFGAVFQVAAKPVMTAEIAITSFLTALIATAICGFVPAYTASKYDPVVALRYE